MGIDPGPNGYELGDPCVGCWDLATPKRFLGVVSGISKCPGRTGNPNGFAIMHQAAACLWRGDMGDFTYSYLALTGEPVPGSVFWVVDFLGNSWFSSFIDVICSKVFTSDHEARHCGPFIHGFGGGAAVFYGPGI